MVVMNEKQDNQITNSEDVGGMLLCILACGSTCFIGWMTSVIALEISSVATIC